jgi:hypothetical protein
LRERVQSILLPLSDLIPHDPMLQELEHETVVGAKRDRNITWRA